MSDATARSSAPSIMLSRDDVDRLLRDDSPESRTMVLEKVAGYYNANDLREKEQLIAEHIFRLLMRDASSRVRMALADKMKDNVDVPRDIVLQLANDIEPVAVPVLRHSPVLSDADLVGIVESSQEMGKLLAITGRDHLSERVSGALVNTNYAEVVASLLGNRNAKISATHLQRIAKDFAGNEDVTQALTEFPNLPLPVVERLISRATDAVAAALKQQYQISDEDLKSDTGNARDSMLLRLLEGDLATDEMKELVALMAADGSLTPSIMMSALCRGQLAFFTMALANMAKVPLVNATKLVADRGDHGFRGLYLKSGLPESMMEATHMVVRGVQDSQQDEVIVGSALYANRLVERVLFHVGTKNIEYIPYFIALIRQNSRRR